MRAKRRQRYLPHHTERSSTDRQRPVAQPHAALTVYDMSRCRAESFYLAPGEYRSFEDWDVRSRQDGQWVQITHRKDVEKLAKDPSWDGMCYVSWKRSWTDENGEMSMETRLTADPDSIEMWRLDERLVNGKRSGVEHHLYKIARKGAARCGGVRAAVGELLGAGSVGKGVVRWFEEDGVEPTAQATALKLLIAAKGVLDESALESLAARMRKTYSGVPMPRFETAHVSRLAFLERYDMRRRGELLLNLWQTQCDDSLAGNIRTAAELINRRGTAGEKGRAYMRSLDDTCSADVVRLIVAKRVWLEGSQDVFGPNVRELLAQRKATRPIIAFHPDTSDPELALEVILDKKRFSQDEIHLTGARPLHPSVASAVRAELERPGFLQQTHSSVRSRNVLRLAVAVCEADPSAAPILVKAYSAWTRTPGALSEWRARDTDDVFAGRKLQLDQSSITQLYQRQTELARVADRAGDKKSKSEELPHRFYSHGLMAVLESQSDAPPAVRDAAERMLTREGLVVRDDNGVLGHWFNVLQEDCDRVRVVQETLDRYAVDTKDSGEALSRILRTGVVSIQHGVTPTEYTQIRAACDRALNSVGLDTEYLRKVRSSWSDDLGVLEVLDKTYRAANGDISVSDLGPNQYSNPVYTTFCEFAQNLDAKQREFLIKETGDVDTCYIGYLLSGAADVVTAAGRDIVSTEIQLRTILAEVDGIEWPEKPKHWSDLPTADFIPWRLADVASGLDGRSLKLDDEEYQVRAIKDITELQANAAPNCMGNCTDSYADVIRKGTSVVLAIGRGDRTEINVSVEKHHHNDVWEIREVKGPHNKKLSASMESEVRRQISDLVSAQSALAGSSGPAGR